MGPPIAPSRASALGSLVLPVLAGLLLGIGGFTFLYAEGFSYMSDDPKVCVDCHLPHGFFGKYLAKAENGFHHSKAFTFQDFHEPIMMTAKNSRILQDNCVNCHGSLMHQQIMRAHGSEEVQCVHCHLELQRKAQWRLDFIAAENSMGFHAPQEAAMVLGEALDYARQGEIAAAKSTPAKGAKRP